MSFGAVTTKVGGEVYGPHGWVGWPGFATIHQPLYLPYLSPHTSDAHGSSGLPRVVLHEDGAGEVGCGQTLTGRR